MDDVKDAIKVNNEDIKVPARKLQLTLAKKEGGWLRNDDPAALKLEKGEIPQDFQTLIDGEQLRPTKIMQYWMFEKNKMSQQSTDQIHVLVVVPTGINIDIREILTREDVVTELNITKYEDERFSFCQQQNVN
ncbi:CRN protein [Phytophthora palmivora]|uniref:CRN protein n=1 Tax=Phytophthora palmivora TaxID=4796 RepID=A0A2P4Y1Z9_9STRA|nr:CRN protein [Phytophthora palmivora]